MTPATPTFRCAVAGVSGYTGIETLRLLCAHPSFVPTLLIGNSAAGKYPEEIYPHLAGAGLPAIISADDACYDQIDVVFACLPHGTSQEYIASLPDHLKIIDLSADFRIADPAQYQEIYGKPHAAPHLQPEAAYGLSEYAQASLQQARLVACPGCYPTCALLPLLPIARAGMIQMDTIIINAVSGISGAGRAEKRSNLFAEIDEAFFPYSPANHRHAPEIEQLLNRHTHTSSAVQFTPHIAPMTRGMCASIYVDTTRADISAESLHETLSAFYADAAFVHVLPTGNMPNVKHVIRTNHAMIGVSPTRIPGKLLIVSVIDNLIKGASGQAIQNANIMFGLDASIGLPRMPFYP